MRPDRCGAIVMSGRRFQGWDVIIATPTGWVIPPATLERLRQYARQQLTPLVYIENLHQKGLYTHFKRSGFGPLEFVQAITSSSDKLDIQLEGTV
jgi:hypothetical protein